MERYGLIVVGGGPGGYSAALRAAALGLKTLLVEKEHLGGTCLNHGCIPTKTLNHSAYLYRKLKEASAYGLNAGAPGIDYARLQERKTQVVEHLVAGLGGLLQGAGVEVCYGRARRVVPGRVEIELPGGGSRAAETEKIILATGSEELVPEIPGIELPGVIFSRQALALREIPASLAVVGGGVIALEMATLFATFGARVSIVQRSRLLRREDQEMVRRLTPYLRRQGIKIYTGAPLERIEQSEQGLTVVAGGAGSEQRITAQAVLVAVGRRPSLGGLDLEAPGIKHGPAGIETDQTMATNLPGIFAVGDAAFPGYFLAHVASHQGVVAAENAAGQKALFSGKAVPVCIFTYPELARAGLTEEEARARGYAVKTGKFPFSANGKAYLQGEADGVVKIVADAAGDTVLGVHILGPHASDLIQEGTLAVASGAKVADLAELIHPHPTLSEALWEAALAVNKSPLHLSLR